MRGDREHQAEMLLALTPDQLVPADHPIRRIKPIVEAVLTRLSPLFDEMYAERGRPSIPPEHLLKASLLIALFSVRSERQFCERLQYDLLFKWFLDLNVADPAFNPTTFSKNRERLLRHEVADAFFAEVVAEARSRRLLSADHFTVDGTLLEAWASLKSYRPRDEHDDPPPGGGGRNPDVDFRGQRRNRETHASRTDPEAQLATKGSGQAAKLCYMGHVLTENRNGLIVGVELTQADGFAERKAALRLLDRCVAGRATLGADRGYDTQDFVADLRKRRITPHVARNDRRRRSAIDGRTTRHPGYAVSQRRRKRVEEVFGWAKTVGGLRKLRYIGQARNALCATLTAAAYNLVRMAKLELATP
ncbi:MAG: IS5 family transposase [Chloroflexi bacterium]|nr:IS5 family transposase [Chloroflexota bacterium]